MFDFITNKQEPLQFVLCTQTLRTVEKAMITIENELHYLSTYGIEPPCLVANVYLQALSDEVVTRIVLRQEGDFGILFAMQIAMLDDTGYDEAAIAFWKKRLEGMSIDHFGPDCGSTSGLSSKEYWLGAPISGEELLSCKQTSAMKLQ